MKYSSGLHGKFFSLCENKLRNDSEIQKAFFTGIFSNVTLFTERVDLIRYENVPRAFVKCGKPMIEKDKKEKSKRSLGNRLRLYLIFPPRS